jgi:hypothetical protein
MCVRVCVCVCVCERERDRERERFGEGNWGFRTKNRLLKIKWFECS